jgi:hypothetical protein
MGTETNWLSSGSYAPSSDSWFNFKRSLCYQKPYCLLMNTDFSAFTHDLVESYFKTSLFYGVYPGMFSYNASENAYWDDAALVERDRDLFKRYIPLIKILGSAGWQPVTFARSSDPAIYVERYGHATALCLTTRNDSTQAVSYTLSLDAGSLGLSTTAPVSFTDRISGTSFPATINGTTLTLTDTLQAGDVRMFRVY